MALGTKSSRTKAACTRCNVHKIKCSGDRPACRACVVSNNNSKCDYPVRSKKVTILNTELDEIRSQANKLKHENRLLNQRLDQAIAAARATASTSSSSMVSPPEAAPSSYSSNPKTGALLPGLSEIPHSGMIRLSNPFGGTFVGELETHLKEKVSTANDGNNGQRGGPVSFYGNELVDEQERDLKIRRLYLDDSILKTTQQMPLELPDKEYAFKLVQEVFRFFAREFGLFEITEFIDNIHGIYNDINSVDKTWISLFLITLATGEQYLNDAPQHGRIPGMNFFLSASKHFKEPLEEPTVDSVRTILLFAFYSQGLNRINSVFSYTGLAISTAMTIGMHRKATPHQMSAKEYDSRRKVWWTAVVMDGLWASRLGLPPHVHAAEMDVGLPDSNMLTDYGFNHKLLLANVQLCLCIDRVMMPMYNIAQRSAYFVTNMMNDLHEVKKFYNSLPVELQSVDSIVDSRSVANLHLRYNQLTIQIVRPLILYILKNSQDAVDVEWLGARESMDSCIKAAKDNIRILETLKNSHWLSNIGMLEAQCCFSALLVLVMATLNGIYSKELSIAVSLHTTMSEAGNITAMDNDRYLKELDGILRLVSKKEVPPAPDSTNEYLPAGRDHLTGNGGNNLIIINERTSLSPGINYLLSEAVAPEQPIPSSINGSIPANDTVDEPASASDLDNKSNGPNNAPGINSMSPGRRLNFVADLEPSETGLHQYSPEMLYNLSVNFQNWEEGLELQRSW